MFYIVRNKIAPATFADDVEREAYEMPLQGINFNLDNGNVY